MKSTDFSASMDSLYRIFNDFHSKRKMKKYDLFTSFIENNNFHRTDAIELMINLERTQNEEKKEENHWSSMTALRLKVCRERLLCKLRKKSKRTEKSLFSTVTKSKVMIKKYFLSLSLFVDVRKSAFKNVLVRLFDQLFPFLSFVRSWVEEKTIDVWFSKHFCASKQLESLYFKRFCCP